MGWKFWKKEKPKEDDTVIIVTTGPGSKQLYVAAKSSDKALEIYNKLKDE